MRLEVALMGGIRFHGIACPIFKAFIGLAAFLASAIRTDHTDAALIDTQRSVIPFDIFLGCSFIWQSRVFS